MPDRDNGNDNIFATGDSRLQGDTGNGSDKSTGASDLPPGRIDPDIARATAGSDATGNATGNAPGKPAGDAPASAPGTGGAAKRGPGRPRKDPNAPAGEKTEARNIRVSFIEKTLHSIHLAAAAMTQIDELKLDADDAHTLGEAIAGVAALYKVRMTPKQEAFALLFEAMAQVYPPMVLSAYLRLQQRQKTKPAPTKPPAPAAPPPPAPMNVPRANGSFAPGFDFDPFKITIPKE